MSKPGWEYRNVEGEPLLFLGEAVIASFHTGELAAHVRARRAVTAVNAHEDLLAALRSVEWAGPDSTCPACGGYLRHGHREGCGCGHKDVCVVAAAIAKAEGR